MPTNDGYSPYALGLSAIETKVAITRAHNLSAELLGYQGYTDGVTPPTLVGGVKEGDIWHNETLDRMFRAFVDKTDPLNHVLVFFEV